MTSSKPEIDKSAKTSKRSSSPTQQLSCRRNQRLGDGEMVPLIPRAAFPEVTGSVPSPHMVSQNYL